MAHNHLLHGQQPLPHLRSLLSEQQPPAQLQSELVAADEKKMALVVALHLADEVHPRQQQQPINQSASQMTATASPTAEEEEDGCGGGRYGISFALNPNANTKHISNSTLFFFAMAIITKTQISLTLSLTNRKILQK